jgi:hypothetical protein
MRLRLARVARRVGYFYAGEHVTRIEELVEVGVRVPVSVSPFLLELVGSEGNHRNPLRGE